MDKIDYPLDLRTQDKYMYKRGWNDAVLAAAEVAEQWSHGGDPGVAAYAAPRVRDRIKKLYCKAD